MPGLNTNSPVFQYYNAYSGTAPGATSLPPGEWYGYQTRSDYLQTTEFANISYDLTVKLNVEAGVVALSLQFPVLQPLWPVRLRGHLAVAGRRLLEKVGQQVGVNYKITDKVMVVRRLRARVSATAAPTPAFRRGATTKACRRTTCPTRSITYEIGWKSTHS